MFVDNSLHKLFTVNGFLVNNSDSVPLKKCTVFNLSDVLNN